jgi:PBSX family phage portal protein
MAEVADETDKTETEESPETQVVHIGAKTFTAESYQATLLKALLGPIDPESLPASNVSSADEDNAPFSEAKTLDPPVDPRKLLTIFELSNALRQNVDAYKTNIDGFGHHFEPLANPDDPDFLKAVAEHLKEQRTVRDTQIGSDPEPDEIDAKVDEVRQQMVRELRDLKAFFLAATEEISFPQLRKQMRQDLEVLGYGFWEVLRDKNNRPGQFEYLAGHTVRLRPKDVGHTDVVRKVNLSPFEIVELPRKRRFRQFVQIAPGLDRSEVIFFKEFGDPRVVSSRTGAVYKTPEAMEAAEKGVHPATEVVHFRIHSARTPYGIPRWAGVILAALGSHEAEEINLMYFENKSVPPMALLVSGGRVTEETVTRIQDFFENEMKGKKNFHKIIVLEAEGGTQAPIGLGVEHTGRMRIELVPLTQAMNSDALFQKYDERNITKIGATFRLPALLRGDSRDVNRATAQSALKFAESQVFSPERADFDDWMNRHIFPALGIQYWKYVSNSPKITDPLDQAKVLDTLTRTGGILPIDARVISEDILNTELARSDQPWVNVPFSLSLAGRVDERILFDQSIREGAGEDVEEASGGPSAVVGPDGQFQVPSELAAVGDSMPQSELEQQVAQLRATGTKREVLVVPQHIWKQWEEGFTAEESAEPEKAEESAE